MKPTINTVGVRQVRQQNRWLTAAAALAAIVGVTASVQSAQAQKIVTVVLSEEPEGLDGCNANRSTVGRVAKQNIVETLTEIDPKDGSIRARLATSWTKVNATTWRFELRKGVKFHDGTPFTADSVIATFDHAKGIEGVGAASGAYVLDKTYKKIDDYTIHISAGKPYPLLPNEMSVLYIYPKAASVDDFNSGKAAIGTGPFKFKEWMRGDRFVVERNPNYWGKKPEWDRVTFKPIKSGPSRIAALLTGDVDIIDQVPTTDVQKLKDDPKLRVVQVAGERIIMLQVDSNRDLSPFVFTNDGKPFFPNPLRKWEVRKAISKAINRQAIVDRVMQGAAVPAGQLPPDFMIGHDPSLKPEPYDPDGAKRLLTEAGYPKGFRLTVHCPNDRYINDEKICETV
ncbi:MAG: ABC transporter substrate-binding protein, partial [Rhodospirillaceae bacterium]|nr:ABC transporter substrate-binding protein [Rhodospirillaceae bacterium]